MNEFDNYQKNSVQGAFKQSLHNVSNTDDNLAWYEEIGETFARSDSATIWHDYKYINDDPGDDSEFYANVNSTKLLVWKKYEKLRLKPVNNKNSVFYNELFNKIILKENFRVFLYDAQGDQIPFGLNRWTYSSNNGYLSFLDGKPDGYDCSCVYVTFYRYEGRMLKDSVLSTEGDCKMLEGYTPREDLGIATKGYVDSVERKALDTLDRMTPPEPLSLSDANLTIVSETFSARSLVTGNIEKDIIMSHDTIEIVTDRFWKRGFTEFELLVNNGLVTTFNILEDEKNDFLSVIYNGDFYEEQIASRGFYEGLQLKITIVPNKLPYVMTNWAKDSVTVRARDKTEIFTSRSVTFGVEKDDIRKTESIFLVEPRLSFEFGLDISRHVSGVSTFKAGAPLRIFNYKNVSLHNYFLEDQRIGNLKVLGYDVDQFASCVNQREPEFEVVLDGVVPDNYYEEIPQLYYKSYDLSGKEVLSHHDFCYARIDTISDESNRLTNDEDLSEWDPSKSIADTNELQMCGGKMIWPEHDYSVNGVYFNLNKLADLGPGINYTMASKSGVRYAVFSCKAERDTSGIYIEIPELDQDRETFAFKITSVEIKVIGKTGWLDAKKVFDGLHNPTKDGDGCLSAQKSNRHKIYCTFGSQVFKGTIAVRIGRAYEEKDFTKPVLEIVN